MPGKSKSRNPTRCHVTAALEAAVTRSITGKARKTSPPPPDDVVDLSVGKVTVLEDTDDHYYVEKIVDYKVEEGKEFFLIKWLDWDAKWNSWEPAENVDDCEKFCKELFKNNRTALRRRQKFFKEQSRAEAQALAEAEDETPGPEAQLPSVDDFPFHSELPRASLIVGDCAYSYIPEEMIKELDVKVPFQIIGRDPGIIPESEGDSAILVLWTEKDPELRVILESVAKKYFPEKLNEFDILQGMEELGFE